MGYLAFGDEGLPDELDARVRSELRDGERLLWVGQPLPALLARQARPVVIFGAIWTAFSAFWTIAASGILRGGNVPLDEGPGRFFPLIGLPFVLIGIGLLCTPIWIRRRARRTCYALTDRRAILWIAGPDDGVEVRTYAPGDLSRTFRVDYRDGAGDLVFEEVVAIGRDSDGDRTTSVTRHGFLAIDRVQEVEELLRKALGRPGGNPEPP